MYICELFHTLAKLEDLAFLLGADGGFFDGLYEGRLHEVLLGNFGGFVGGLDNGEAATFLLVDMVVGD